MRARARFITLLTAAAGLLLAGALDRPCAAQIARGADGVGMVGLKPAEADAARSTINLEALKASAWAPPAAPQQLGDRVKRKSTKVELTQSRERNYNRRENRLAITLGSEHINFVTGGFEQGAGFALGVEFTTGDEIPGVEFRATVLPTFFRLYRQFEGEAYIPKIGDDRTHASVWYNYLRRTKDNFFGIGPRSREADETNYDLERRGFNATLFRDFTDDFEVGVHVGAVNTDAYRGRDDNDPPIDVLFSSRPTAAVTRFAPGLNSGSRILSYGVYAEYDGRDDDRGLTKGIYLYGRVSSNDGLEKESAFTSDYGWTEAELDARGYIPLGGDKTSLALRVFSELKEPKGGSLIPFYNLSRLGGRSYVRGYSNFRFYGENTLLSSLEFRRTVLTQKEDRGFDVVVFADAGQAWGDNRSFADPAVRLNDRFDNSNWRSSMGVGAQYRFSKAFAFRLDLGRSNEATKIYVSLSRGF